MEYRFGKFTSRLLLVSLMLLAVTGMLWAQGTGELTGLITDPTGAVLSNLTVNLTNTATGEKRTTQTTTAGAYRFPALPVVGTYTLQVAPKGFKAVEIKGIVVSVGTVVTKDVTLEIGTATEQVTVEAGAEAVQTTESSLSQLVDRNIWQNMPLQIRNQNSFIELVPGAVPQDGSGQNRGAVVNGTRGGTGSYLVEGMDNKTSRDRRVVAKSPSMIKVGLRLRSPRMRFRNIALSPTATPPNTARAAASLPIPC